MQLSRGNIYSISWTDVLYNDNLKLFTLKLHGNFNFQGVAFPTLQTENFEQIQENFPSHYAVMTMLQRNEHDFFLASGAMNSKFIKPLGKFQVVYTEGLK